MISAIYCIREPGLPPRVVEMAHSHFAEFVGDTYLGTAFYAGEESVDVDGRTIKLVITCRDHKAHMLKRLAEARANPEHETKARARHFQRLARRATRRA